MPFISRPQVILIALVAIVYLCVLKFFSLSLYPLYSDELTYLLSSARYSLDGYSRLAAGLVCHAGDSMALPWLVQIPALILSPLGHIQHPIYYRLLTSGIAIITMAQICLTAHHFGFFKHTISRLKLGLLLAFLLSLMTFSPASITLVLLRGEYVLFLMVPTLLYFAGLPSKSTLVLWLGYGLSFVLFSTASYIHSKGLFFLPFVLWFVWRFCRELPRSLRILLLLPFLGFSWQMTQVSQTQLLSCPETPLIAQQNASFIINPVDLLTAQPTAWHRLIDNNKASSLAALFQEASFRPTDRDALRLFSPRPYENPALNRYSDLAANLFILGGLLLLATGLCWLAYQACRLWAKRTVPQTDVLRLSLLAALCIIAYTACSTLHTFYNVATLIHIVSLCVVFSMLASLSPNKALLHGRWQRHGVYGLLSLLLIGNLIDISIYARNSHLDVKRMPILGHDMTQEDSRLQHFLPRCGTFSPTSRFIVDERSYFHLRHYPKPVEITWLWIFVNLDIQHSHQKVSAQEHDTRVWDSVLSFMHQQHMSAIVTYCSTLENYRRTKPAIIQEAGVATDQAFCCIPGN